MKKLILLLALLTILPIAHARPKIIITPHCRTVHQQSIPDGWYKATVEYYNSKTYFRNTYILKVKVVYGSVTVIDFGNGGSVHAGYNQEGYSYAGGYLSIQRDYSTGEIISANASVTVTDRETIKSFTITIT